ncbi:TonB domain-containing protein [Corallococcus coralloides DSM 2259]|uniref:TonB domain-containing protein n=1 Tax=Corallococcus coralloides (strain ATCC 25202 / DSM 2259 / NBRC 100086 / M2) TaxID=1144275 RepID=H8MUF5_CORCM|nr:energy transducer TonB [Corallococcus coralloides]AFE06291.1 TonB domain-containing protein [Corallococcus coralloides DSM 2259]
MFESVIERRGVRSGRFGTGAWVSIGVHAGLLGLVFFISGRAPELVEKPLGDLVFRPPTIQLGVKQAAQPAPATTAPAPKPKPKPRTDRIPLNPKPLPADPPAATPEPTTIADAAATTDATGTGETGPVGDPNGDPNSTSPIGAIGVAGIVPTAPTGTDVLPFQGGMTPPKMLSGSQFSYTEEARRAGVEGMIIAKCVITTEGRVRDCRIIRGLPFMDDAVLDALYSRQYQPLTFQGRPVNVSYTFNIRLKMPR